MKRLSWKYIAGLIDGEGCIDMQRYTNGKGYAIHAPRLRIAMAAPGKEVIEMLHTQFGGSLVKREAKSDAWMDSYSWELTGYSRVCSVLRNVVSHLIIKKEQARLVLWMETALKGKSNGLERAREIAREQLKAMKRDPHRLSETAQREIISHCDAIVENED